MNPDLELPAGATLSAIVHLAGPDETDRLDRLHALTAHHPVEQFVLITAADATLGSPGSLDAAIQADRHHDLVLARRALGLPAIAVGFDDESAVPALLAALTGRTSQLLLADIDWAARLSDTADVAIPALLADLTAVNALREQRRQQATESARALVARLTALPEAGRLAELTTLVRSAVARTLGHQDDGAVQIGTSFRDLGFSSVSAVELRDRLSRSTGLALPATAVFDHPTCTALAAELRDRLLPETPVAAVGLGQGLDQLEAALLTADAHELVAGRVADRLAALLDRLRDTAAPEPNEPAGLDQASASEIFDFIDNELGLS